MPDHVHMMISIPPKYAVSQVVGFIKGKSAIHLARVYGEKKRNFVGQHFWARGYFVSTVGRDEAVIREYIRNQEQEDNRGPNESVTLIGHLQVAHACRVALAPLTATSSGPITKARGSADVPTYKRDIGMMFQNYALFPHMSLADNIAYGLKVRHVPKKERDRRVEEVLALVRLTGLEGRKPRQLSGGQQQRVAQARALVINPTVLLLDEPFSAFDKNLRASMQVELREIQRKLKVTTILRHP